MEESNSYTLYPSMMQKTRLLVIDYDVIQYHSLDLLRYSLLDRKLFVKLKPEFYPLIQMTEVADMVDFYKHHAISANPFDCFDIPSTSYKVLEDSLNIMFQDKLSKTTPTDIQNRFDIVFERPGVSGFLLQYNNSQCKPSFYNDVIVYNTSSIFDMQTTLSIIIQENINAIMLSSVDMAILISGKLSLLNYKHPISYIIANYRYNYDNTSMKHLEELNKLEYVYKNEFGIFDPFSGISYRDKLLKNQQKEI